MDLLKMENEIKESIEMINNVKHLLSIELDCCGNYEYIELVGKIHGYGKKLEELKNYIKGICFIYGYYKEEIEKIEKKFTDGIIPIGLLHDLNKISDMIAYGFKLKNNNDTLLKIILKNIRILYKKRISLNSMYRNTNVSKYKFSPENIIKSLLELCEYFEKIEIINGEYLCRLLKKSIDHIKNNDFFDTIELDVLLRELTKITHSLKIINIIKKSKDKKIKEKFDQYHKTIIIKNKNKKLTLIDVYCSTIFLNKNNVDRRPCSDVSHSIAFNNPIKSNSVMDQWVCMCKKTIITLRKKKLSDDWEIKLLTERNSHETSDQRIPD